ncbi:hypothetical protein [Clostridium sp. HMP27]|uniref:hypothetical protein n=1 Tax=Clostridium sp. HMP27 TaxID=1487921 RepID=UPI00052E2601|nr:hypothetical protein [Clostridium sp. HMP27]KGK89555.1 hypothetical protein DP68_03610 [Clostridium sp. HMP27]
MVLKIKKDNMATPILTILKCMFIILIFFTLYIFSNCNPNIIFWANMVLVLAIISECQFSLVTLVVVISNYVLINLFFYYQTGQAYGILAHVKDLNYSEMLIYNLMFNFSIYIWITLTKFLDYEKILLKRHYWINRIAANTCAIIAIIAVIIAFPQMIFTFDSSTRFQSLLPGNGWNHLAIVALIFAVTRIQDSMFIKISLVFIVFWFLAHYERVDIVGFCFAFISLFAIKKNLKINAKFIMRYGIMIFIIFGFLVYIGEVRAGNISIDLSMLLKHIVSQNTASDIGYVFHSSTKYVEDYGLLQGRSYITYIQGAIPMFDTPLRAGGIIKTLYGTPGGEYILTEPVINFGFIGVLIVTNIYMFILYKIVRKSSAYRYYLYIFLMVASFRFVWYGLSYIETAILYFIPFIYFLCRKISGPKMLKPIIYRESER